MIRNVISIFLEFFKKEKIGTRRTRDPQIQKKLTELKKKKNRVIKKYD